MGTTVTREASMGTLASRALDLSWAPGGKWGGARPPLQLAPPYTQPMDFLPRLVWRLQARLATSGLLEDSVLWEKMPRSIWNDECAPSIRTLVMGVVASFLRSGSLKSSMKQRGPTKGAEGDLMEH